jgi:hypothetical protein
MTIADLQARLVTAYKARLRGGVPVISKIDVKAAYRLFQLHPSQWRFLIFLVNGKLWLDARLAFGLCCACRLFSAFGLLMRWLLEHGVTIDAANLLDDYAWCSSDHMRALLETSVVERLFRLVGAPTKPIKTVAGEELVTFLGWAFCSRTLTMRIPVDKVTGMNALLTVWSGKTTASLREVQQLAGVLCQMSEGLVYGRLFLRRVFAFLKQNWSARPHEKRALGVAFRLDLRWWKWFVHYYNGEKKLVGNLRPVKVCAGDASDAYGSTLHENLVCQVEWAGPLAYLAKGAPGATTAIREMFMVLCAAITFGSSWSGCHVLMYCDNKGDVLSFKKWRNLNATTEHLMRVLTYVAALCDFTFEVLWVKGELNVDPDLASRVTLAEFHARTGGRYTTVPLAWLPPLAGDVEWEALLGQRVLHALRATQAQRAARDAAALQAALPTAPQ